VYIERKSNSKKIFIIVFIMTLVELEVGGGGKEPWTGFPKRDSLITKNVSWSNKKCFVELLLQAFFKVCAYYVRPRGATGPTEGIESWGQAKLEATDSSGFFDASDGFSSRYTGAGTCISPYAPRLRSA